jgi:hypothetical protein
MRRYWPLALFTLVPGLAVPLSYGGPVIYVLLLQRRGLPAARTAALAATQSAVGALAERDAGGIRICLAVSPIA